MAEYARAAAAGEIQYGEGGSAFILNQQAGSPRDVGAVRAEAIEAARSHPQPPAGSRLTRSRTMRDQPNPVPGTPGTGIFLSAHIARNRWVKARLTFTGRRRPASSRLYARSRRAPRSGWRRR